MRTFTLDNLKRIMQQAGGADGASDLSSESADKSFDDLGYDSLAVLEIAARIQEDFTVRLSDDVVERLATPSEAIAVVNELLAGGAQ